MKKILILFLFFIPLYSKDFLVQKIQSVYDGDTFIVDLNCSEEFFCKSIPIRVSRIDCPEIKGKTERERQKAKEAKEFTKKFLKSNILLKNCSKDKYFRLDCDVISIKDSRSLSEELITRKLAIPYDGRTKTKDWSE